MLARSWPEPHTAWGRGLFAATLLVNDGSEVFGCLYAKRLVDLGLLTSPDPIVWYTALGIASLLAGAIAVYAVEAQIAGVGMARRIYGAACLIGALGIGLLAIAPDSLSASVGILLVGGISLSVARITGSIWLNRQVTSELRATVHSFLAQAEYLGEIVCGFVLAVVAGEAGTPVALAGGTVCLLVAGVAVLTATQRWKEPSCRLVGGLVAVSLGHVSALRF